MKSIIPIISTLTFRHSAVTFVGVFTNGLLGMLFFIFSARYLGPSQFGLMTIAIAVLTFVSDISDLGTNTGIVRFVGKYWNVDRNRSYQFLKLGLIIKIIVGVCISVAGILSAPFLAIIIFQKSELTQVIQLAFLGVSFSLLFTYISSILQATQRFKLWSGLQITTNIIRLLVLFAVAAFGLLTLNANMSIYAFAPLSGFIIGCLIFIPKQVLTVKSKKGVLKEFVKYNRWIAMFVIVAATASRLDTFISARLLSNIDVGYYGAANQLVQIVPQIIGAIGVVLAPKMASIKNNVDIKIYINKVFLMVLGISLVILAGGLILTPIIPILYGAEFIAVVPIFWVLLFAMLVFLIALPFHNAIFYYFAKPKIFFSLSLGHLLIISILGWILISKFGVIGAAISVLIGQLWNFIVPFIWVKNELKRI